MTGTRTNRLAARDTARELGLGVAVVCLTLALGACGGGDEEAAAVTPPTTPPPAGNQAPTIAGAPGTQAMQDQQYVFTPTANDPNGDALTFTITGAPSGWTFNSSTGRLSGTPTSAQAGMTFSNIRIAVSDGTTTVNLTAFNITVVATATGSATLSWTPPTSNTDGSPLTNLAGYRVYWGPSAGNYTNSATVSNPGLSSYVVEPLTPATWYFALTAVNSAGSESAYSNVASKVVL
jgi:hypothetical protein